MTTLLLVVAIGVCPLAVAMGDCLAAARGCHAAEAASSVPQSHSCCDERAISPAAEPCCCGEPAKELARACLCQPQQLPSEAPAPAREAAGESLKWASTWDVAGEPANLGQADHHRATRRSFFAPAPRSLQSLLCIWRI